MEKKKKKEEEEKGWGQGLVSEEETTEPWQTWEQAFGASWGDFGVAAQAVWGPG